MSNTDHAAEPTMEEILSSIRKIISDDDKGPKTVAAKPAPKPRPVEPVAKRGPEPAPAAAPKPRPVEPAAKRAPEPVPAAAPPEPEPIDQSAADDIFDLTEVVDEAPDEGQLMAAWRNDVADAVPTETPDDVDFAVAKPEPEPMPMPEPARNETPEAAPAASPTLLSEDATNAASAAFGQLANTLLSRQSDARTLEELVQEMLRPMLQAWLNENLPPLVERLVREEIERVARRR